MQPVIEVQCPFCDARGQIVTPPLGAIIVGPCPRCEELVLLFSGAVLPLDKEIILNGTPDQKKGHLTETIMEMVTGRIGELVDNAEEQLGDTDDEAADLVLAEEGAAPEPAAVEPAPDGIQPSLTTDQPGTPITDAEVRDFLDIDLHLIDQKVHFEKIFGLD